MTEQVSTRWLSDGVEPAWSVDGQLAFIQQTRLSIYLVQHPKTQALGLATGGRLTPLSNEQQQVTDQQGYLCLAQLPPLYPEWLGSRGFCETHHVRFPYIAGAMARGITSVEMVVNTAKAGMLGFFGSAGLSLADVESSIQRIKQQLPRGQTWGCNLIHTPEQPDMEAAMVDCFIKHEVNRISASAFMGLSKSIVAYAYKGIYKDSQGNIQRQRHVFAKISRPETATAFLKPAPEKILQQLVNEGRLSETEAQLGRHLPVAEDITVEADSGGHTDSQILTALFPSILQLSEQISTTQGYTQAIRVGAAGGLGTPSAVAAAFALGAAYVLTGSINQSCIEAGTSSSVKELLTQVQTGDVAMAPCADMFEAGVKVQVLKRRSLYAVRSSRLYDLYKRYTSLDEIPSDVIQQLEQQLFHQSIDDIWANTNAFFEKKNPAELSKAHNNPKYKMALIFRWYLGSSSRWPIVGDQARIVDFQIWCGPAMAAFNDWVKGSFLEPVENRHVVQVARNLLEGALQITRAQQLRALGLPVNANGFIYKPRYLE